MKPGTCKPCPLVWCAAAWTKAGMPGGNAVNGEKCSGVQSSCICAEAVQKSRQNLSASVLYYTHCISLLINTQHTCHHVTCAWQRWRTQGSQWGARPACGLLAWPATGRLARAGRSASAPFCRSLVTSALVQGLRWPPSPTADAPALGAELPSCYMCRLLCLHRRDSLNLSLDRRSQPASGGRAHIQL